MAQRNLPIELPETLLQDTHAKQIPAGQIMLYEGDIPLEVYILQSGVVKIYDIDEQGNEKILHLVKPLALLPFAFFSGLHEPLNWFYTALTDCTVYGVPSDEMREIIRTHGDLAEKLTNAFSDDVHELLLRLSSLGKTNARDKITAALIFLAGSHAVERRSGWWRVNFAVSHQMLADLCGITRESAALAMKELQGEQVVRYPRMTVLEINRRCL